MDNKLKVLLIAYACEPNKGSEQGVGWNWAFHLSKMIDVTVCTRANNEKVIKKELAKYQNNKLKFIYFDIPIFCKLKKKIPYGVHIYYFFWQLLLPIYLNKKKRDKYDIIHHITFNSFSFPSFAWLISKNFIWGPIGGGQKTKFSFIKYFGKKKYFELFRSIYVSLALFNPLILICSFFAKKILVANRETENKIFFKKKTVRMLETGINKEVIVEHEVIKKGEKNKIKLLWIGSLEPHKAPYILFEALSLVKTKIHLTVIGQGNLKRKLIELAANHRVLENVSFLNDVPHNDIFKYYQNADIFIFTSIRDTSGNVVLEAMSQGLPVVSFDHHGMHDILTDECAIKIKVTNFKRMVEEVAEAIDSLANNPERRIKMGKAAIQRIKDKYLWEEKAKQMVNIYNEIFDIK